MADPPLGRLPVAAVEVGQVIEQHAAQPAAQLRLGMAPEAGEIALRVQKRLLDQVRGPALGAQLRIEFPLGHQEQVAPVRLQRLAERLARPGPRRGQPLRSVARRLCHQPIL